MKLFAGYDDREAVGFHAFLQSLIETSPGVAAYPLTGSRTGESTNSFTLARFLIPELCAHDGWALFVDGSDMLLRSDIRELFMLKDKTKALQVVKHDYKSRHERKYIGTELESNNVSYPRKNWSSLMLINCGHTAHYKARHKIREAVGLGNGKYLHRFSWLQDEDIGDLPREWNHLVGELPSNPKAKLVHFTLGIPGFDAYSEVEYADEWRAAARAAVRGLQYEIGGLSRR